MSNRRKTFLLLALGLVQLVASTALLLWAGTSRTPLPRWAGVVDVVLAFTLVVTSAAIRFHAIKRTGEPRDAGQGFWFLFLATLPSLVLMALWLGRSRLDWNILLPGLAWRLFLVLYTTPYVISYLTRKHRHRPGRYRLRSPS